jgi:hypothetical protein
LGFEFSDFVTHGTLARRQALGRNDGRDHLRSLSPPLLAGLVVRPRVTLKIHRFSRFAQIKPLDLS